MFTAIKKYLSDRKEYKDAKKAVTLTIMNTYFDYLVAETEAKEAEKKAYESMTVFGESFSVEDLRSLIESTDKIASNPELTTEYYKQVSRQAHEEKMAEMEKDE